MKPSVFAFLAALVSLPACASSTTTTAQTPQHASFDGLDVEQEMAIRRAMLSAEDWHLTVPERVAALCPGSRPPAPGADLAENRAALRWSLRRIAECYRDGALKNDEVAINATASPGHRSVAMVRARSFADVLTSFGVSEERIVIKTRDGNGFSTRGCSLELRDGETRAQHASY